MLSFKNYFLVLCLLALFCTLGCQKKKSAPPELLDIDLLRGDLILCGSDQFGEVSFSLSCSYETRETFDLAVSLLHSFEYEEAEKAFVKVMDADPECVMAYWGVAMSISYSLWRQEDKSYLEKGSKLLEIAHKIPTGEKEKDYLDAISVYYKDYETLNEKTRALSYEKKMEAIYKKNNDDNEAAVFYALALRAAADRSDKSYSKQKKAGKILEDLFVEEPNHPGIAHYIIHNYDYPGLAHLALATARKYASIAPASSHAQHMPSHIFTQLGLWDESIESNVNSVSSAQCYAESSGMEGHSSYETHAMGFLVYAYLQKGDNKNANEQYQYMKTMYKLDPFNIKATAGTLAGIPSRMVLENKKWQDAANLEWHDSELEWDQFPWQKSKLHFTRALGAARTNNFIVAENEIEILKTLEQEFLGDDNKRGALGVMMKIKMAQAWVHLANENNEEALVLMKEAADMEDALISGGLALVIPAIELLADMLLELNNPTEALDMYEVSLKKYTNRFNGIYGAAIAAKESGNQKKATKYFEELIKLTEGVDSDRSELEEAREFVGQKGS
jgi:hypothetical protein